MSSIEEKVWEYIDGTCSVAEQETIEKLISGDERYRHKYEELLAFNQEMATGIELDEPPMAFTYNVMETIRTEYARQKPLQTQVNKTLVRSIGGFFIVTLLAVLIIAAGSINWSAGSGGTQRMAHLPDFKNLLSGNILNTIMFFDTVLLLYLVDGFLRKRTLPKQS